MEEVLDSNKWSKWIINGDNCKKVDIAGHYLFNYFSYKEITNHIGNDWQNILSTEIYKLINTYLENL